MSNTLKSVLIKDFIKNGEAEKLLKFLRMKLIIDDNENTIEKNILSNYNLITIVVEQYNDLLINFRFKNEIITLYNLMNYLNDDYLEDDFILEKFDDYIDNMRNFNLNFNVNFNVNDDAFLWGLLYHLFYVNDILYTEYIVEKFNGLTDEQKLIGFIRFIDFNINERIYISLWNRSNPNSWDEAFLSSVNEYGENILLKYEISLNDNFKIYDLFKTSYKFEIFEYSEIYIDNNIKIYTEGNIIKHHDKYYIGNYIKKYMLASPINISERLIRINPFINTASKRLNEILSFILVDDIDNKHVIVSESWKGEIINNVYVKTNYYKNSIDFSIDNLTNMINEIDDLNEVL